MGPNRLPVAIVLALLVIVGATGCPDSDVFNTGNFEFIMLLEAENDQDWPCVLMNINEARIRPLDGTCSDTGEPCFDGTDCPGATCEGALANESVNREIGIVEAGTLDGANFSDQGALCEAIEFDPEDEVEGVDFQLQYLSPGLYDFTLLRIGVPTLVSDDGTINACGGYFKDVTTLDFYADDILFEIGANETNTVRLILDAAALEAELTGDCVLNLDTNLGITNTFRID